MSAFDDAVAQIRGPSVDDLIDSLPTPAPQPPPRMTEPATVTTTSTTSDGPPASSEPVPHQEGPGVGESFLEDAVDPWLSKVAQSPYAPMATRLVGAIGGGVLGGPLGAGAAAALVEPGAQALESLHGEPKSIKRAALNVGFSMLGGASRFVPVSPILKAGVPLIESSALNSVYQLTSNVTEGQNIDWPAVRAAAQSPLNLMALPFGSVEYLHAKALLAAEAKRAVLPSTITRAHIENGGSTFDAEGNSLVGQPGYAVSLYPERSSTVKDQITDDHVSDFIDRNRDLLDKDPRNAIGTWHDTSTDTHYLDISAVLPDRDQAIDLARKYNQKAIFDLQKLEEIPTGGTGEPVPGLAPEGDRLPPYQSGYFADLRNSAQKARDWMSSTYRESRLADTRGEIGDLTEPSDIRPRDLKTLPPIAQNVRANLTRIAADSIFSDKGTNFADWSANMVTKYGDDVTPHLKAAWKSATTVLNRRMRATLDDLPSTQRTMELLSAGRDGEDWYGPMRRELTRVFGDDTDTMLRFIAATSPQANIEHNLGSALKAYVQYKAGAREVHPDAAAESAVLQANIGRRRAGLEPLPLPEAKNPDMQGFRGFLYPDWLATAAKGSDDFGGPKVRNFLKAMQGDPNAVVVDRWMQRYLGYKPGKNGELPGMSDAEYAVNADYLRQQADAEGMTPASFQERIWRGIKKEAGTTSVHTDEPYQVVIRDRHAAGLPLFSESTLATLNGHESSIADAIEQEMRTAGRANPTAEGIGSGFDWSTGEVSQKAEPRIRRGQSGSVKLDSLLPVWAALKIGQGINKFSKLVVAGVQRFGEGVKSLLPRAWVEGRRRAFAMADHQVEPPEGVERTFVAGRDPVPLPDKERATLMTKYGKAGTVMADLLERHASDLAEPRGELSTDDVQALADQIKTDMTGMAQKYGKGQAATAEEIKHIADLTYTLDRRLAAAYNEKDTAEASGTWTKDQAGQLAELEQNYVNLQAVRRSTSAEAGRALAAHQITARLRNRDLDSLLNFASRRGLSTDDVQAVFRSHQDPLSRAQAIQAMSKLSMRDLYSHARYWTMLADPATAIHAGFSNVVTGFLRQAGRLPGTIADKLFNRGNRWMYGREINPRSAGLVRGMTKGFRRWYSIMTQGQTADALASGKVPPTEMFADRPVAGFIANLPFRAIGGVDAMTNTMFTEGEMNGFAFARAMKQAHDQGLTGIAAEDHATRQAAEWTASPPEWLLLHGDRLGRQISLQSPLGVTAAKVQSALRDYPIAGSFVMPFLRTSVNMLKETAKATPAGLLYARRLMRAAETPEAAKLLAKQRGIRSADVAAMNASGGPGTFQESLMREAAVTRGTSLATTGIIAATPLLIMAGMGDVTGDPPADPAERARLANERPFNAVRIGNVWIDQRSIGHLEPILRAIGNAKQAFDVIKRTKGTPGATTDETHERIVDAALDTIKGLGDAGPLKSLNGFLSLFDQNETQMAATAGKLFKDALILPAAAEKVTKYTDPWRRHVETFTDPLTNAFTPSKLAPVLDPKGQPVPRNPWPVVKGWGSAPDEQLNEAAKAGVAITAPNEKTLSMPHGDKIALELPERRVFNRALGLANAAALKDALQDRAAWASYPQDYRREYLTKVRDNYRSRVTQTAQRAKRDGQPLVLRDLIQSFGGEMQP